MRKQNFTLLFIYCLLSVSSYSQQNYFNGKSASLIIGQLDSTSNISASVVLDSIRTHEASGIAVSAKGMLAVSNYGSTTGRVMLWNRLPTANGEPADVVIGKPNFSSTNSQGGQSGSNRIRNGSDVCFSPDGSKMIVADENNHRVLIWNSIPSSNGRAADVVLGQPDFISSTPGLSQRQFNRPNRVLVSADGRLLIVDQANNRVLIFNQIPQTNFDSADVVIGQADFNSGLPNTGANRLNTPTGISISPTGKLYVSEAGGTSSANYPQFNNRILVFDSIPQTNNQSARLVLGNSSLSGPSLYADNPNTLPRETGSALFNSPRGTDFSSSGKMAIADERSHRALVYLQPPVSNQAAAQVVLGLPAMNTSVPSTGFFASSPGTPNGSNMAAPYDLAFDPFERLFVAGSGSSAQGSMNRVMVFGDVPSSSTDIGIQIRAISDSLCNSGTSQFLFRVFNNGPVASGRIGATAALPPYFTLNRNLTLGGGSYNALSGQLIIDSLGVGDTVSVFLEGTLRSGSRIPDTLYTYAGINGLSLADPNMSNNGAVERFQLNPVISRAMDTIAGNRQFCQGQPTILHVARELFPTQYRWTVINGTFTVIPNGVGDSIIITGTSDSLVIVSVNKVDPTCSRSLPSVILRATQLPSMGSIQAPVAICAGVPAVFRAAGVSNANFYRWTLNGQLVGQGAADSLSVTISQSPSTLVVRPFNQGCSRDSISRSFTFSPRATSGSIAGADTICVNSTESYTFRGARNTTQYVWTITGATASGNDSTRNITAASSDFSIRVALFNGNCPGDTFNKIVRVRNSFPASISISTASQFCSGSPVIVTANTINGGSGRSINWFRNSVLLPAPLSADTLVLNTAQNSDTIRAVMTSSFSCASPNPANSNSVVLNVINSVLPTVSITADSVNLCGSDSVTVRAIYNNGGTSPVFNWQSSSGNRTAGDVIRFRPSGSLDSLRLTMTTNATCAQLNTVSSAPIFFRRDPIVTPTISLLPDQTAYCQSSQATITAQTNNLGTGTIQWLRNGVLVSPNPGNALTYIPSNNDSIQAIINSSLRCTSQNPVSSSIIVLNVNNSVVPVVSIVADSTTLCGSDSVFVRATFTNGGSNPVFVWSSASGSVIAGNVIRFRPSGTSDSLSVVMQSSAACALPLRDTSNTLHFTQNSRTNSSAVLQISSSTICTGDTAQFNLSGIGLGSSPTYSWNLNGNPVSNSSSNFSLANPQNNDSVFVLIQSSDLCASPRFLRSNTQTIQTGNQFVVSVSVSASDTSVCAGDSVLFSAISQNGGASPVYQWFVNGSATGTSSNSFLLTSAQPGDSVFVLLRSSLGCVAEDSAFSAPISLQIANPITPSITISASDTLVCQGTPISLLAAVSNAGINPTVEWYENNQLIGRGTSLTYSPSASTNLIHGVVRSAGNCVTSDSVSSNVLSITATASVTPQVSIQTGSTTICRGDSVLLTSVFTGSGSNPSYSWFVNGNLVGTGSQLVTTALRNGNEVVLLGISNESCRTADSVFSAPFIFNVLPINSVAGYIRLSDTVVCEGSDVIARAVITSGTPANFAWSVNQTASGINNDSLSIRNVTGATVVELTITPAGQCPGAAVSFNQLIVETRPKPSAPVVEEGSDYLYVQNPEPGLVYIWFKNESELLGENNDTLFLSNAYESARYICRAVNQEGCFEETAIRYRGSLDDLDPFRVYPNPFGNIFTLETDIRVAVKAAIYDQTGSLVKEFMVTQSPLQVETSWLTPGMYNLKVFHELGHKTFKIVKTF